MLYVIFQSYFAEIHFKVSFLKFPIFIGEILLAVCVCFYFIGNSFRVKELKKQPLVVGIYIYIACICGAAFFGYFKWSSLALRHAALFYYPLFSLLTFWFVSKVKINRDMVYLGYFLLFVTSFFAARYWIFCYAIGMLICLIGMRPNKFKVFLLVLTIIVIPYGKFIYTARMFILGNLVALLFLLYPVCADLR